VLKKTFDPKRNAVVGKIRNFMTRTFLDLAASTYYPSNPRKEDWMGGACGTCVGEEKIPAGVLVGKLKEMNNVVKM
jgi:hypothetical protein